MKKLLILVVAVLFLLSGCVRMPAEQIDENEDSIPQESEPAETSILEEFSFRGHKFWDSLEEVIKKEGGPKETD